MADVAAARLADLAAQFNQFSQFHTLTKLKELFSQSDNTPPNPDNFKTFQAWAVATLDNAPLELVCRSKFQSFIDGLDNRSRRQLHQIAESWRVQVVLLLFGFGTSPFEYAKKPLKALGTLAARTNHPACPQVVELFRKERRKAYTTARPDRDPASSQTCLRRVIDAIDPTVWPRRGQASQSVDEDFDDGGIDSGGGDTENFAPMDLVAEDQLDPDSIGERSLHHPPASRFLTSMMQSSGSMVLDTMEDNESRRTNPTILGSTRDDHDKADDTFDTSEETLVLNESPTLPRVPVPVSRMAVEDVASSGPRSKRPRLSSTSLAPSDPFQPLEQVYPWRSQAFSFTMTAFRDWTCSINNLRKNDWLDDNLVNQGMSRLLSRDVGVISSLEASTGLQSESSLRRLRASNAEKLIVLLPTFDRKARHWRLYWIQRAPQRRPQLFKYDPLPNATDASTPFSVSLARWICDTQAIECESRAGPVQPNGADCGAYVVEMACRIVGASPWSSGRLRVASLIVTSRSSTLRFGCNLPLPVLEKGKEESTQAVMLTLNARKALYESLANSVINYSSIERHSEDLRHDAAVVANFIHGKSLRAFHKRHQDSILQVHAALSRFDKIGKTLHDWRSTISSFIAQMDRMRYDKLGNEILGMGKNRLLEQAARGAMSTCETEDFDVMGRREASRGEVAESMAMAVTMMVIVKCTTDLDYTKHVQFIRVKK